jgi:asparagine synthase (glutamine-hydrolysing)
MSTGYGYASLLLLILRGAIIGMCGICGKILFNESKKISKGDVEAMNTLQHHRGPDEDGYFIDGNVCFGHKRLSIIDLKSGQQPISSFDDSCVIIFNGEIYNFPELRENLLKKGRKFKTKSDTEVILRLYEDEGPSCVHKLRGMFAFAIWDKKKKQCFMARDRIGKKSLYYTLLGDSFIFASEMKCLMVCPGFSKEIDYEAMHYYLTFQYVPAPKTIFKGVKKLEPGCSLIYKNGNVKIEKYWDLNYTPKMNISEAEALEKTDAMIDEAVRIRLISEVPLGCFLSGGVDSSAVVAYMRRHIAGELKTFAIGFEEQSHNELPYAKIIAEKFGTTHEEFIVRPDAMDMLPKLVWHFDEPYADSSALPTYYVSKMTRQYVTVALNGDGGDESFIGYERYTGLPKLRKYMSIPKPLRVMAKPFINSLFKLFPDTPMLEKLFYANTFSLYDEGRLYLQMMTIFRDYQLERMYSPEFKYLSGIDAYQYPLGYYNDALSDSIIESKVRSDIKTYLPGALLPKVDRTTMANSLEGRSPFLDQKLMEYAATLPMDIKFGTGVLKHHLKKVLKDILPHDILWRKKQGFGVPVGKWFQQDLFSFTKDILLSEKARSRGIFDMKYIEKIINDHKTNRQNHHHRIWALLCLELWFMTFMDSNDFINGPITL